MIFRSLITITILLFSVNIIAKPIIVVSIKPIHSIVSNLTKGVSVPILLLESHQSAHHFHLRPSQLLSINQADLIISIHPRFEAGLAKTLRNINRNKQIIMNSNKNSDNHSWLDIGYTQNFSAIIAKKLMQIDPSNTAIYQKNLRLTWQMLERLKYANKQVLSTYQNTQFATFSNALIPFLRANHLNRFITVTHAHEDTLSIRKIYKAKQAMQTKRAKCLLSTTEIPNKRIKTLTEGLTLKSASIDIIGVNINKGKQHYFQLLDTIGTQTAECLK